MGQHQRYYLEANPVIHPEFKEQSRTGGEKRDCGKMVPSYTTGQIPGGILSHFVVVDFSD